MAHNTEKLRELLERVEDTLRIMARTPTVDPHHGEEIRRLGEHTGYGAMMVTASALWAEKLGGLRGEFVVGPDSGTVANLLRDVRATRALISQAEGEAQHG